MWNNAYRVALEGGGAGHLTAPNMVGAEVYLSAAATIIRGVSAQDYSSQNNNCYALNRHSFGNCDPLLILAYLPKL